MIIGRHLLSRDLNGVYNSLTTEILREDDLSTKTREMAEAKPSKIRNFLSQKFEVISRDQVPPDTKILQGRFFFAIKASEDGRATSKARYVIGGHRDRFKEMMVHFALNLQPQSVGLLLAFSAVLHLDIGVSHVKQAYVQYL